MQQYYSSWDDRHLAFYPFHEETGMVIIVGLPLVLKVEIVWVTWWKLIVVCGMGLFLYWPCTQLMTLCHTQSNLWKTISKPQEWQWRNSTRSCMKSFSDMALYMNKRELGCYSSKNSKNLNATKFIFIIVETGLTHLCIGLATPTRRWKSPMATAFRGARHASQFAVRRLISIVAEGFSNRVVH